MGSRGWRANVRPLAEQKGFHVVIVDASGRAPTFAEVFEGIGDEGFRDCLTRTLQEMPYEGFYWEAPPVSAKTAATRALEFVVIPDETGALTGAKVDSESFANVFAKAIPRPGAMVAFPNLGGDAMLCSPRPAPGVELQHYSHLASFLRHAIPIQVTYFWTEVMGTFKWHLEHRAPDAVWLSTAGQGVAWVHVRLDSRPKYYQYAPYRSFEEAA